MAEASGYQASKPINPQSYYVRRPYGTGYGYGRYAFRSPTAGAFEGGQQFGNELMQGIAKVVQARQQQAQQAKMDAVANQLMNTQNAPRAALAGQGNVPSSVWNSPATWATIRQKNLGITGTQPLEGGLAELSLRQQFAQQQLENAYKQAQIADLLAKTQGTGAYARTAAGHAITPYQQEELRAKQDQLERQQEAAVQAETKAAQDKTAITESSLMNQFDKRYGKGQAQAYLDAFQAGSLVRGRLGTDQDGDLNGKFIQDDNGDWVTTDQKAAAFPATPGTGMFGTGIGGQAPIAGQEGKAFNDVKKIRFSDLQAYQNKLQDVQDAGGKLYPTVPRAVPVGAAPPPGTEASRLAGAVPAAQAQTQTDQGTDTMGDPFGPGGALDVTGGGNSNLPMPTNQADYDAIDSGASFIDGDGQVKVKP